MVKPGTAERIEKFVEAGGTFVTTYWSGIVNENDLCFLGGFPGPLRKVTGIWSEEIDALYDNDVNYVVFNKDNEMGISGEYKAGILCDLIHAETARVLAVYKDDFYAGRPAVTVNTYGKGEAYYIASRNEDKFALDFYTKLIEKLELRRVLKIEIPYGISVQSRTDGENEYIFIMNFNNTETEIDIGNMELWDMLDNVKVTGKIVLKGYGVKILKR